MESLKERIEAFLRVDYGSGDGSGSGKGSGFGFGDGKGSGSGSGYSFGFGDGFGDGSGSGSGSGSGKGSGSGSGYSFGFGDGFGDGYSSGFGFGYSFGFGDGYSSGFGEGSGIKNFSSEEVYIVDGVQTIIRSVWGNVAHGAILQGDLTLKDCFIVKQNNLFAHGETLREAMTALRDKLFEDMPEEERIEEFIKEHEWGVKYSGTDLYEWHHRLTGSCEMGRKQFAADRGIDIDNSEFTVEEFIDLCKNAYGGEVIQRLAERYKETT